MPSAHDTAALADDLIAERYIAKNLISERCFADDLVVGRNIPVGRLALIDPRRLGYDRTDGLEMVRTHLDPVPPGNGMTTPHTLGTTVTGRKTP